MALVYRIRDSVQVVRLWNSREFLVEDYRAIPAHQLCKQLSILELDTNTPSGAAVQVKMFGIKDAKFYLGWVPLFNNPIEIVDTDVAYSLFDGRFNQDW
jgi:hypothetical protein